MIVQFSLIFNVADLFDFRGFDDSREQPTVDNWAA